MTRPEPPDAAGRRARRRGRRLALSLGAGLAMVAVAEGALRGARRLRGGPTTNPGYVVDDEELGWAYRPGARTRHRGAEFDVALALNRAGFRDDEFEASAPSPRALLLGDSYAFGWGVEREQALERCLERELGLEVDNLAVSGYSTDQQLLLFRRAGKARRPTLVIVLFCGNDVEEALREQVYGMRKPRFELLPDGSCALAARPGPRPLWERSCMLLRIAVRRTQEAWRAPPRPEDLAAGRTLVAALLERLAAEVAEGGGRLLVAAEGHPWLEALLRDRGRGIGCVDLSPLIEAARGEGACVRFPRDGHWTADGHAAAARAIAAAAHEMLRDPPAIPAPR